MKKKILGILILVILLTGCSNVNYDLNINLNSFEENLSFSYSDINNIEDLVKENLKSSLLILSHPSGFPLFVVITCELFIIPLPILFCKYSFLLF